MNKNYKTLILNCAILFIISLVFLQSAQASIISYSKKPGGVVFKLDKGLMSIKICKADIIEVRYTVLDAFPAKTSLVVNNSWKQQTNFTVAEHNGLVIITTSKLVISVSKKSNAITYSNLKGSMITSESEENKSMNTATIAGINTYN